SRDGQALINLTPSASNPETAILINGKTSSWDWNKSGTVEMNCFLCHTENPDSAARITALQNGDFGWANTATLANSNIVQQTADGWAYVPEAFDETTGELLPGSIAIQDPTNANCAQCHGVVQTDREPLVIDNCNLDDFQTATTGQVVSPQKIANSGMNISGKDSLNRSWDVHAERQVECTDCHFSLNNPATYQGNISDRPEHLTFDPRRIEIGEYLQRPIHDFARGESAQFTVDPDMKGTMRRCGSCHDVETHANWLPYVDRHMEEVACETCHIPQMYAPAIESYDWTTLQAGGEPLTNCRGGETGNSVTALVTGYQPALLMRPNVDGDSMLAPYNLIASWYWLYDDANEHTRPVRQLDLEAAFFENGQYAPEVLSAFDANNDGVLTENELRLDSDAKTTLIAERLSALGLGNPRISGEVQPYSINHNVARGDYAINDCTVCHSDNSRLTQPMKLADYVPAGVDPAFVQDTNISITGEMFVGDDGALYYQPVPKNDAAYVFGSSRISWIDWFGGLLFLAVILGVGGHATLRYLAAKKNPQASHAHKKVYMYDSYERFWHWLQTIGIVTLLLTGLIIHRPDMFGAFSFRNMVLIHNVIAAILGINAGLSLFYHLTTGEIQQYIPRPRGFIDDTIVQTKYYLYGIFKGDEHPFEKRKDKKLNPLQQATYFGLLNVLLPLQGLTGIMMWGAQKWPSLSGLFGGLPFLAPLHTLTAWLFAAFIIGHVYLTTTGAKPLEGIQAMITGWEEVEVHDEGNES
ncbi:MAG: cytochrome b/b6 domain-containing protein, partial [Anaerolineales bacterium]|nr:cytochrome b/b6 domain-containing protein [Anaerolineales bacterium]